MLSKLVMMLMLEKEVMKMQGFQECHVYEYYLFGWVNVYYVFV